MRARLRAVRNNMLMALLIAHDKFSLQLTPAVQHVRSLWTYINSWRSQPRSSRQPLQLDLQAVAAQVSPSLDMLYPAWNSAEIAAVHYKTVCAVLRYIQRDEQHKAAVAFSTAVSGTSEHEAETYESLRRQLGSHYLTPSESRALLDQERLLRDTIYDSHIELQLRSRPSNDFLWGPFWQHCMQSLPRDCIVIIISFIPAPRLWGWSLRSMKNRIVSSPNSCMTDLFTIVDEVFAESGLFRIRTKQKDFHKQRGVCTVESLGPHGEQIEFLNAPRTLGYNPESNSSMPPSHLDERALLEADISASVSTSDNTTEATLGSAQRSNDLAKQFHEQYHQKRLLVHIARSSAIQQHLLEKCDMPHALLQSCIYWSTLQAAVVENGSKGMSFTLQEPGVHKLYLFVKALYKWFMHRHHPLSMLDLPLPVPPVKAVGPASAFLKHDVALCFCKVPCVYAGRASEGPLAGREYYSCGMLQVPNRPPCGFFQWGGTAARTVPLVTKFSPFNEPVLSLIDTNEIGYNVTLGLSNEGIGACVNYLVETTLLRRSHRTPSAMHVDGDLVRSKPLQGPVQGIFQRGIPGINYADTYDSDDSDDSSNQRQVQDRVGAETDDDQAGGADEGGESDGEAQAPPAAVDAMDMVAEQAPHPGVPQGVPFFNQGL